ncbi:scaffoldin [Anaeromyces robustus]|uniref:Scaffoldin n=1 Tax=Anaeromyces robustus TaxID=1754192 RepID=A0A1Y1X3U6_9FUNG|nr:scaffoldin [Anaeromyces robustus]|eukprot:ORX80480.1 scaffoldin [Anaeromyces robustus]
MKSKSTILKLSTLIGCLILSNKVSAIPNCKYDATTNELSNPPCIDKDYEINLDSDDKINGSGNYFFYNDKYITTENKASQGYVCEEKDSRVKCTLISKAGLYFIDNDGYSDSYFNVYINDNGLAYQYIKYEDSTLPSQVFVNEGATSLTNAIITCKDGECKIKTDKINSGDVYLNSKKTLIKCSDTKGCVQSAQSDEGIFLNADDDGSYPLIKCAKKNDEVECNAISGDTGVYYMNGVSSKNIIHCSSSDSCKIYVPSVNSFFNNGNYGDDEEQLISCHSNSCSLQYAENYGHYLSMGDGEETYSVISCTDNNGEVKCSNPSSDDSKGYFRNSDENTNTTYPLIQCISNGCNSLKIGQDIYPGYYVDKSTDEDEILICTDTACTKDEDGVYQDKVNGNYRYTNSELQLCIDLPTEKKSSDDEDESDEDKYSVIVSSADNSDALYYFVNTPSSKGFPGVTSNNNILYKVTKYYISRVITDGVIYVSDTDHRLSSGSSSGTSNTIYNCNKSKKTCTSGKTCVSETYFLDTLNNAGYYCNKSGDISQIETAGFYINNSNENSKKTLISCDDNKVCVSVASTNYYVNAGSDSTSKPLIYCDNTSCRTASASTGYYLSGSDSGIIKCTSSTSCDIISLSTMKKTEHFYLNNGEDNGQKGLIKCKGKSCSTIGATSGYYITNDNAVLINCENSMKCTTVNASAGYYNAAVTVDAGKKIIECSALTSVNCELKDANPGYYVAKASNVLVNCNTTPCKAITVNSGIYRSATTQIISSKRDSTSEEEDSLVSNSERATSVVYNIISCSTTGCNELTTSELLSIPICTFNNNKCFINNKVSISTTSVTAISAGSYCTNSDRSILYFATDTIVIDPEIIDGTTSIYTYTTTTTNCIEALDKYSSEYFTIGSSIYKINESSIVQLVSTGYYFINVETNTLVSGNSIESYNNENVKLFKCNDSSCSIIDKPETATYYADVNKRIIMFNPNSDSYSFAYENDITCIYANNKCTPKSDIKNMEFCITYKGELALVVNDIKSRETGECFKADTITSKIYGLSQYMYSMNAFSAERIVDNAYYVVSMSTNNTATIRDYDGRNNSIKIYGCVESKCDIYEPEEDVYYYDSISRYMFKYENDKWVSPQAGGYALVSTNPNDVYVNRFSLYQNKTTIDGKVRTGYYYTVDKEMYECDQDKYVCEKISDSGYYFTVSGEIYQCVYDSEGIEATECIKRNCVVGQYYYLNSKYYYCGTGFMLNLVSDKTCEYDDKVIVNFPVAFSESYPDKIKSAVENISLVNNSTAVVTSLNTKYIQSVSGVFTNCTYTVEEKDSEFDLVCVNNYVAVNEETDDIEICSLTHMGFVECIEDENNPEKCNPSGAISMYKKSLLTFMVSIIVSLILFI